MDDQDERTLLTGAELASMLKIPRQTLYSWRSRGEGPPGIRVGRHIRYRREAKPGLAAGTRRPWVVSGEVPRRNGASEASKHFRLHFRSRRTAHDAGVSPFPPNCVTP